MFTHPQFNKLNFLFKKISEANLRKKLAKFFPNQNIVFTNLGRSAFQLAIQNLNLENSEMLVPAYICDIFLPIFKHYNIKPIYLDIDLKSFNIKISEIEKKITSKTKSILVCHTYGNLADDVIQKAKKHNLKVIEDCAHISPLSLPRGTRGDCAFFSFSKLCPTINGGMLVCKNSIKANLKKYKCKLSNLIKFARLFPVLAVLSEKFRKSYEKPAKLTFPKKASKKSLNVFNWYLNQNKEKELIEYFHKKLQERDIQSSGTTYISALVPNRNELFTKLRKKGIYCSRIWHKPIYKNLSNTSIAAKRIINFPLQNWFTKKDIDKIIKRIKFYLKP